ncbi:response regulator [Candidatus Desantisbacteria bacterium]|nr:response regulator [Candidatus Desantisbacteria bacterium]
MLKVLVIEDEKYLINILKDILHHLGFKVSTATSKSEAIKKIKKSDFHFVLLDLFLQGGNAKESKNYLKNIHLNKPVIIMSGSGSNEISFKGISPFAFLHKPFGIEELKYVINKVEDKYFRMEKKLLLN